MELHVVTGLSPSANQECVADLIGAEHLMLLEQELFWDVNFETFDRCLSFGDYIVNGTTLFSRIPEFVETFGASLRIHWVETPVGDCVEEYLRGVPLQSLRIQAERLQEGYGDVSRWERFFCVRNLIENMY